MWPDIKKETAQNLLPLFKNTSWKSVESIKKALTSPKLFSHGHLALPIFSLAKELGQNPKTYATDLAEQITNQQINHIVSLQAIGGFINFKFSSAYLGRHLCHFVFSQKENTSDLKKKIIIEYSSPNVAKPLGMGHLRASVIGQALYRLAKAQGFYVIGLNHLGDWGVQFGHLAWAYQQWKEEYDFESQPLQSLYEMYVRFHNEAKVSPELKRKGSEFFRRLESGIKRY